MTRPIITTGGRQGRGDPAPVARTRRARRRLHLVDLVDLVECIARDLVGFGLCLFALVWFSRVLTLVLA